MLRFFIGTIVLFLMGCSPEVEVYAPDRDTHIVWCVLDAQKDSQYVKITRAYQSDGDALAYADEEDFSLTDLQVTLEGNGQTIEGELEDVQREPGIFQQTHTLYRFDTDGANRIVGGQRYFLRIRKPDDPTFLITSWTDVPSQPKMMQPAEPVYNSDLNFYTLPLIDFEDDYPTVSKDNTGEGFEARVYVDYLQNGEMKTIQWGPLPVAREPKGCEANIDRGVMCIRIPGLVVGNTLARDIDLDLGPVEHYDTARTATTLAELSKLARVEFTAVDCFLTRYLFVNNSFGFGLNLLIDKPELNNVTGADAGVFGSINKASRYIILDECTKYKAGFVPMKPSFCD